MENFHFTLPYISNMLSSVCDCLFILCFSYLWLFMVKVQFRKPTQPKFDPTKVWTHNLLIMTEHFMQVMQINSTLYLQPFKCYSISFAQALYCLSYSISYSRLLHQGWSGWDPGPSEVVARHWWSYWYHQPSCHYLVPRPLAKVQRRHGHGFVQVRRRREQLASTWDSNSWATGKPKRLCYSLCGGSVKVWRHGGNEGWLSLTTISSVCSDDGQGFCVSIFSMILWLDIWNLNMILCH